jgi:predicted nucleic acid-binding protein
VTTLVDTNLVIDLLRRSAAAVAWFDGLDEQATISAVSLLELYAGARSQSDERDLISIRRQLTCLPISEDIGERAGAILRHYRKSHGIDLPDAIIAATAEHHELRLATLNVKHFPMFPKLRRAY